MLRSLLAFFRSREDQAIAELALRQQLALYVHRHPRPRLSPLDRTFWVALSRIWPQWRRNLVVVRPETVIRWRRKAFRGYWRWISKPGPGRPPIPEETKALIARMATENGWRARKIQAELSKLGIHLGLTTISRYLGFTLLYVWFVLDHGRRRVLNFNVTSHPSAAWVMQQLRDAFPDSPTHRYLIFDNDAIFATEVSHSVWKLGIHPKRTALQSPWQNGTAERFVGSVRRELLDHVVVLGEDHLRRLLHEYVLYYNSERVHTSIGDAPEGRAVHERPSDQAKVIGLRRVGGLHHRYVWAEAA
jgi:transposase InsO family protein